MPSSATREAGFRGKMRTVIDAAARSVFCVCALATVLAAATPPTFSDEIDTITSSGILYGLQAADFNQDGKLDIVGFDIQGGVYVYLGNEDGTFRPSSITQFPNCVDDLQIADYNNDGIPWSDRRGR